MSELDAALDRPQKQAGERHQCDTPAWARLVPDPAAEETHHGKLDVSRSKKVCSSTIQSLTHLRPYFHSLAITRNESIDEFMNSSENIFLKDKETHLIK